MKKYERIFLIFFALFFAFLFVFAPLHYILVQKGIVTYSEVGNIIEVEKVYEDDDFAAPLLNAVEEAKRTLKDIYVNYLPLYVETTFFVKNVKDTINTPFTSYLSELSNEVIREQMEKKKQNKE